MSEEFEFSVTPEDIEKMMRAPSFYVRDFFLDTSLMEFHFTRVLTNQITHIENSETLDKIFASELSKFLDDDDEFQEACEEGDVIVKGTVIVTIDPDGTEQLGILKMQIGADEIADAEESDLDGRGLDYADAINEFLTGDVGDDD